MENYSGRWTGEMQGTNSGNFILELKHEGQEIRGNATFRERRVGSYECSIVGSAGAEIRLELKPTGRAASLGVGPIYVVARPTGGGRIAGQWNSIMGRGGNFDARRISASPPPSVIAPARSVSQSKSPVAADRPVEDGAKANMAVAEANIAPAHSLWVELATRAIGAPDPVPPGAEVSTAKTIYQFFPMIRDLMTKHPLAREFQTVALSFQNVLRPFVTKWHATFEKAGSDPDHSIAEAIKKEFRVDHAALQVKAYGVRKALDALREQKMYHPSWIRPDAAMLVELQAEFRGSSVLPEEEHESKTDAEPALSMLTGGKACVRRGKRKTASCA